MFSAITAEAVAGRVSDGDMRRHRDRRMAPERMIGRQRLDPEHVERGVRRSWPASSAASSAASSISVPRPGLTITRARRQQRQPRGVHQVLGRRRRRQQQHQDLGLRQHLVQPGRRRTGSRRPSIAFGRRLQPSTRKPQRRQRPGAGRRPARPAPAPPRCGRGPAAAPGAQPCAAVVDDVRDRCPRWWRSTWPSTYSHHALFQPGIDHPGQRLGQRRVADDLLDPGPEAQHRLRPREGARNRSPARSAR